MKSTRYHAQDCNNDQPTQLGASNEPDFLSCLALKPHQLAAKCKLYNVLLTVVGLVLWRHIILQPLKLNGRANYCFSLWRNHTQILFTHFLPIIVRCTSDWPTVHPCATSSSGIVHSLTTRWKVWVSSLYRSTSVVTRWWSILKWCNFATSTNPV